MNQYFTGDNGTGGYIEHGYYVGARYRTDAEWAEKNLNRCRHCHPSPVPPFPDCPHGHYLSPQRLLAQMHYDKIHDLWIPTAVWFVGCFIFRGALIVDLVCTFFWLIVVALYYRALHRQKKAYGILLQGGPWAEGPNFVWEKRGYNNDPWNRGSF